MPLFLGCANKSENRFLDLLELIPRSDIEDECFFLIDYEKIWKRNGIEFPEDVTEPDDIYNIISRSSLVDVDNLDNYAFFFSSRYTGWGDYIKLTPNNDFYIQHKYMGYGIPNVAAEINNSVIGKFMWLDGFEEPFSEPDLKVAAIGKFNPQDTKETLERHDDWSEHAVVSYVQEQYDGVTIHNWVDGTEQDSISKTGPPHMIDGKLLPLVVTDNQLFVAESTDHIKEMLNASKGKTESLADVPEYALVADGLFKLDAYAAIIGDETLTNRFWGYLTDYPLKPFLTFGTGYGRDEQGAYIALVLVHENEELANINANFFPERFEKYGPYLYSTPGTGIYKTKVETEGRVLLAKLYTDDHYFWYYWLLRGYSLLYHGN
jgi:hypothetical protein